MAELRKVLPEPIREKDCVVVLSGSVTKPRVLLLSSQNPLVLRIHEEPLSDVRENLQNYFGRCLLGGYQPSPSPNTWVSIPADYDPVEIVLHGVPKAVTKWSVAPGVSHHANTLLDLLFKEDSEASAHWDALVKTLINEQLPSRLSEKGAPGPTEEYTLGSVFYRADQLDTAEGEFETSFSFFNTRGEDERIHIRGQIIASGLFGNCDRSSAWCRPGAFADGQVLPNPTILHERIVRTRFSVTRSYVHGDLHLGNVVYNPRNPSNRVMIIDPKIPRPPAKCPIARDAARLEVTLRILSKVPEGSESLIPNLIMRMPFTRFSGRDPLKTYKAGLESDSPVVSRIVSLVGEVRKTFLQHNFGPDVSIEDTNRWKEYWASLYFEALKSLTWPSIQKSDIQRRAAVMCAAQAAMNFMDCDALGPAPCAGRLKVVVSDRKGATYIDNMQVVFGEGHPTLSKKFVPHLQSRMAHQRGTSTWTYQLDSSSENYQPGVSADIAAVSWLQDRPLPNCVAVFDVPCTPDGCVPEEVSVPEYRLREAFKALAKVRVRQLWLPESLLMDLRDTTIDAALSRGIDLMGYAHRQFLIESLLPAIK